MITPTSEDLDAAFARLRKADWPASRAELAPDSVRAHLVHSLAVRLARPIVIANPTRGGEPPLLRITRPLGRASHPPQFDRKRAAAGEREDD